MHKGGKRKGFTLVELSLSIAFISMLSLAVALIIMNAISAYHRGVVLNQVNTTGMEIVDDMRAAVQGSPARSVASECTVRYLNNTSAQSSCSSDGGKKFITMTRYAKVMRGGTEIGKVPVYGVFCTGSYSYIWNSGYFFSSEGYTIQGVTGTARLTYRPANSTTSATYSNKFRLLKVRDDDRAVCIAAASTEGKGANYGSTVDNMPYSIDISGGDFGAVEEDPIEILPSDGMLAIYSLTPYTAINGAVNNMFYSVSFILGTVQGGMNIKATNDNCVPPEDYTNGSVESFDYCAINKFNFAAQANGG